MKQSLPERSLKIKNRLSLIVEEILAASQNKIAKIILFGSYARGTWVEDTYQEGHVTYSYQSDLDLLIIIKSGNKYDPAKIEENIDKRLKRKNLDDNPFVALIIESINEVNKQLAKGQYFFSDIKKGGILLYDSGEYELSVTKELNENERKKIASEDYDYWFYKGSEFIIDAYNAFVRTNYKFCAFYLHQATESFYNTILLVFSGYKPKLHDIKKLSGMVSNYHEDLLKIFPADTEEQKESYRLLRKAYIDARYNKNYIINQEQINYLLKRVSKLQKITQEICQSKISKKH